MRFRQCAAHCLVIFAALTVFACARPGGRPAEAADNITEVIETGTMIEKLAPCPESPNCVCSEYPDDAHAIPPLAFDGDAERAWTALRAALDDLPRTKVLRLDAGYLRAESRTAVFRFVDDLEARLDASAGVIHVRSASRVGYSDLGANRKRVEALRERFARRLDAQS